MAAYTVTVPATTGNLGPGFDCLGAALSLYNRFEFAEAEELRVTASGPGSEKIAKNKTNLVYQSLERLFDCIGRPKPVVSLDIKMQVPLSRGLGSSATAIVGGLMGANLLAGSPLDRAEILRLAIEAEGHPDNVVPALLGGCQLVAMQGQDWQICGLAWPKKLGVVALIPEFELSTSKARQVLPKQVPLKDAVFNAAHLALLTQALATGNLEWLQAALHDRLHQPYRQSLIPGLESVREAALGAGAIGLVISGAGPTLLALAPTPKLEAIGTAAVAAWQTHDIAAIAKPLTLATEGTTYQTR